MLLIEWVANNFLAMYIATTYLFAYFYSEPYFLLNFNLLPFGHFFKFHIK